MKEEARRMSYSCTSRGSSQDPSSAQRPAANQPGGDGGGADGGQTQTAAMRVKKGCNSTDVGVPVTTEEDLLASTVITPEDVLGLQKITESKLTCRRFRVFWGWGGLWGWEVCAEQSALLFVAPVALSSRVAKRPRV